jgi:hypothetical protein
VPPALIAEAVNMAACAVMELRMTIDHHHTSVKRTLSFRATDAWEPRE